MCCLPGNLPEPACQSPVKGYVVVATLSTCFSTMPAITSSGARPELAGGGSSAPVLEFLCLFTHDLQRKQKRWQDGRLKYHTFNKRVMVYDDRGNSVGDMHWQRDWDFDEGEEIKLDRGGVIVQVQECVGRQNQDLTDLLDKRAKEKEERQSRTAARMAPAAFGLRTPAIPSRVYPAQIAGPRSHHRRLDQALTPTGHHGRALVPTESPFEQRQRDRETPDANKETSLAKRRKHDDAPPSKLGYAQSLFGAPLTLSAVPMSSAPVRRPAASATRMHSGPASSQENDSPAGEPEERESHPSKRRKRDDTPPSKMGYSQSLFGATLNLSAVPMSSAPALRRTTSVALGHTEPPSSPERGPQPQEPTSGVQEIPVNPSVRAGLSRSTVTAPLLKTRLPPLGSASKPAAKNEAVKARARQRDVAVEFPAEDTRMNSDTGDSDLSATRNRNAAKYIDRGQIRGQKVAPKPKKPPPVVILDHDDDDDDDDDDDVEGGEDDTNLHDKNQAPIQDKDIGESRTLPRNMPKQRSKKPTAKTPFTNAAPATKQARSSKSTRNSKTKKAQDTDSKLGFEDERAPEGLGLNMPPEGPRAQLRIQPRQKRGLLVSDEKGNKSKKPKVRHAQSHAELEYDGEPFVPNPAPMTMSEEDDSFASFVDAPQEAQTVPKPKTPPLLRDVHSLGARHESLANSQASNEEQPSNIRANDDPSLDSNNTFSVPPPAASKTNMMGANDEGTAGLYGAERSRKRSPGQQRTADLVKDTTQDRGNTVQPPELPRAPTGPIAEPQTSPRYLQDKMTDEEDVSVRPRARLPRKKVTLALDESDNDSLPTRKTKKRMTMALDESDDERPASCQSTRRDISVSEESAGEKRPMRRSNRRTAKAFVGSDNERPPTRQTRSNTTVAVSEESDSEELPQVPVAPRLARLRKSVKSREVIGFIPSSSPVMEVATVAEPRPAPIPISFPAPTPAPLPSSLPPLSPIPGLMDTPPGLEANDMSSLGYSNGPKAPAPGTGIPEPEPVTVPVVQSLQTSRVLPLLPAFESTTDVPSAVRRDNLQPTITSRETPAKESAQAPTPAHLEQSICDFPSGEPPHHHLASAPGADKAGQSAVAHQQTMPTLDTSSTFVWMRPVSAKGPNLIAEEAEGVPGSHEAVSHQEVHENLIAVPRDVGVSLVASNNPNDQAPQVPPAAPTRPKIANPATRGRKAALKSHAAGQVPQSILPLEPAPVRLTVRPPETARAGAAAGGRPRYKMQLPGFTSAKETAKDSGVDVGPWSREAHDLFGSGRPSEA
ncbi:uncharacterized protein QC761_121140 [Podospora bellae-mahoneyi]|uniref:5'-3' DNA helicase ZGRF1-like N-terminal domain-containing protein n=1 Tax=Podospora bellae-mahoneyi TaxID=2093777 RepID=A0ABR0G1T4_9PEZI|nr:hypothetical protein QC761_121140 [Podospora bellae-mahoneyi]